MSSLLPIAREATQRIKQAFPDLPMIWGGIHPTSVPRSMSMTLRQIEERK